MALVILSPHPYHRRHVTILLTDELRTPVPFLSHGDRGQWSSVQSPVAQLPADIWAPPCS